MIKTKIGRAAGFGAAAIVAALSFAIAVLAPTPAKARVFVGFGFGFPIGFPFYYPPYPYPPPAYYPPPPPYYPAPAAYPATGTPNQPPGGYAPSGLAGSPSITYTPRPPTPRGAAGQTRKVNIAGNTGPPGLRAIVRPSVTAPPAGMRAANGGLLIEIGRGGGRSGPASRSGINVLCRQVRGARRTTADRHGLPPARRAARPVGRMSRREPGRKKVVNLGIPP